MAPKTAAKKKSGKKTVKPLADRICFAALKISADEGWREVQIPRLAEELGEPVGEIVSTYPTPSRVADALLHRLDDIVLRQVDVIDTSDSPRDRLFEVLMMRFDALQDARAGYAALIKYRLCQPSFVIQRAPSMIHSMKMILAASDIQAEGFLGVARAHALAVAYVGVLQTWLKDDSHDLSATMSDLDKALERLEQLESLIEKGRRGLNSSKNASQTSSKPGS